MRTLYRVTLSLALLLLPAVAFAQPGAPTRTPTESTPDEETVIRQGIDLHDKGQFDQAIVKYQEVLAKSPANVTALFELAFSYFAKKDYDHSFDAAQQGAAFTSELLPMFYDVMASSVESKGQPQQAVEIYKKGIALVPQASLLYYNMAVTYRESLNQADDARAALEKAATIEPQHPGVQLMLGQVFQGSGYATPAFLALSTFLVLDPAGNQALPGYGLWRAVLKGGVDPLPDGAAPNAVMTSPKTASKTDEGDFATTDALLLSTHKTFADAMDAGAPEIKALVTQVDALLGALPATPTGARAGSFVNTHYVPFFVALKQQNFVEPFVYWASQKAPVPGVREWLAANRARVRAFLDWASQYSWPTS